MASARFVPIGEVDAEEQAKTDRAAEGDSSAVGLGKITKSPLINYAILDLASKKCTTWQRTRLTTYAASLWPRYYLLLGSMGLWALSDRASRRGPLRVSRVIHKVFSRRLFVILQDVCS